MKDILLKIDNVSVSFPASSHNSVMKAVDGVSLEIKAGEVLGLVGESGCGKTTLGRSVTCLQKIDSGEIALEGKSLQKMSRGDLRLFRRRMQMIFQNPYSSLNPRMTILDILSEPLHFCKGIPKKDCIGPVAEMMTRVGLQPEMIRKFPHEFSGGQRQRIAIARALSAQPSLIIADEPVSSLDVSVQAQILSLLFSLRDEMNLTMLFISHDLSVVKYISDRVAVMYKGSIVEIADVESIFKNPSHPYTRTLLKAVPVPDPSRNFFLNDQVADLQGAEMTGNGCRFRSRCEGAWEKCQQCRPSLLPQESDENHFLACWGPK